MLRSRWPVALPLALIVACGDGTPETSRADGGSPAPAEGTPAATGATPRASAQAGATAVEITASTGGDEVTVKGLGECKHAAEGSIYQRPASLWTIRFDGGEADGVRQLNLAFWRERSGTESVTLALDVGGGVHRIATVEGGELQGSARATLEGASGPGVVTVDGTSAEGARVRLRVRCERFTTLVAEGG